MRMAKFLGVVRRSGGLLVQEPLGDYSPGDLVRVFPKKSFLPWTDGRKGTDEHLFRTEELEFLPEKELDLNDYL